MGRNDDILSRLGPAARAQAVDQLAEQVLAKARASAPTRPIIAAVPVARAPLTLRLPMPPTTNNLFATTTKMTAAGTPYLGRIKSKGYRRWLQQVGLEFIAQRAFAVPGSVMVDISCERPKTNKADADNRIKAVLDALVHFHVLVDDSLVEEVRCRWAVVTGCVVTVHPIDGVLTAPTIAPSPLAPAAASVAATELVEA